MHNSQQRHAQDIKMTKANPGDSNIIIFYINNYRRFMFTVFFISHVKAQIIFPVLSCMSKPSYNNIFLTLILSKVICYS